jgi:hypothetical protein
MTPLTIFTWGYYGWGSATQKFKAATDAVEAARGYEPPYFVDARMSRSVRAAGFRDSAFEDTVGNARYRWMRSLGNRRIKTRSGPRIQINEPEAVEELLGLALAKGRRQQRVILFCSCRIPGSGKTICHRVELGSLLLKKARKRNVDLTVVEWPGGRPRNISHELTDDIAEDVKRGRVNVPLGQRRPSMDLCGLPWYSTVHFTSDHDSFRALAYHARFHGDQWLLPILKVLSDHASRPQAMAQATLHRRRDGMEPRSARRK